MNDKVYIHELIDIIGHNRAKYFQHITANWSPIGQAERNQRCYGVWGTVGSTGAWPEVVNIWELDDWAGLAENFRVEFEHPTLQDPALAEWWAAAASLRRGGFDRIMVAAPWTQSIEELTAAGVKGHLYAHELVTLPPGTAPALLDELGSSGRAVVEGCGLRLVGAWRVAMVNDTEAILLWAIDGWDEWAAFEQEDVPGGALAPWRHTLVEAGAQLRRTLLVEAPLSPLRLGRQPAVSDRRPLDEL